MFILWGPGQNSSNYINEGQSKNYGCQTINFLIALIAAFLNHTLLIYRDSLSATSCAQQLNWSRCTFRSLSWVGPGNMYYMGMAREEALLGVSGC